MFGPAAVCMHVHSVVMFLFLYRMFHLYLPVPMVMLELSTTCFMMLS